MLRIGFVGSGLIAWGHGLSLKALIDGGVVEATVAAVYDLDERRARGFADVIGGSEVEVVQDAAEVVRRCDAIWVCTPTAAHRGVVDEALRAGRAVFCEKPLDRDLTRATELVDAVAAAGVVSQSGLVLRSAPVFRSLRDLLLSGALGAPMAAVFRDDQYFPIQGTYTSASQWRADVDQAGGGCLIEHSIHDLDILRYCFGDVESVVARTANHAGHPHIEDTAAVTLSFVSGFEAQLTSVWHDILSRGSTRRLEVFCREGMVWLDDEFRGPLHVQTSDSEEERPCPSPAWVDALPLADDELGLAVLPYVEADRTFLEAVVSGSAPEPGLDVALEAHRLVEAAYRSASRGGATVEVSSTRG